MNASDDFGDEELRAGWLTGWRAWLSGMSDELPGHRLTPFGTRFATPCSELLPELGRVVVQDVALFDWMFPADRYCLAKAGVALLHVDEVHPLLTSWGMDARLRGHYVRFLSLFGATVDPHGCVLAPERVEASAWRVPELTSTQTLAVARVLRMLRLAGWRGTSVTAVPDHSGCWYDMGLQKWLMTRWNKECRHAVFPRVWREALDVYALPTDVNRKGRRPREHVFPSDAATLAPRRGLSSRNVPL